MDFNIQLIGQGADLQTMPQGRIFFQLGLDPPVAIDCTVRVSVPGQDVAPWPNSV